MKTSFKFLAVLLLISNITFGQDVFTRMDSIVKKNYQNHPEVGISVGFITNGKTYYTNYGTISKESQTAIDQKSIFEIASITKMLTSNVMAQAVLDKKIKLDDYIDTYLPKAYTLHKNISHKIKISDLASHQSGLPDLDFGKLIERNAQQPIKSVTQQTLSTIINNCDTLVDYGKYRYSTIGYTLLGQILENVYGKNYDAIIRENLINPLQMTTTLTKDFNVKNKVAGYNPQGGAQEFFEWNITAPAGLVKSNTSDMILFLKAVLNNDTRIGKAAIITEQLFYKDQNRAMGLGTNIVTDDQNTLYMKSGDSMGQSSIICYNRVKNWGIILLLNQRNSKMRQNLLNDIYETLLK